MDFEENQTIGRPDGSVYLKVTGLVGNSDSFNLMLNHLFLSHEGCFLMLQGFRVFLVLLASCSMVSGNLHQPLIIKTFLKENDCQNTIRVR